MCILGLEESCGYLVGTHARDKDAVSAAMMIAEACAYFKEKDLISGIARNLSKIRLLSNGFEIYLDDRKRRHVEIDSVTFERGKPTFVDTSKKPIAGEMCEGITDHWGFAAGDICFKSIPVLIETLLDCRKYNCNLLLNVGPTEDGTLTVIETEILKYIGSWIKINEEIIYNAVPADIQADNADIFVNGEYYYAAIRKVPMSANVNVARIEDNKIVKLYTDKRIEEAVWLDNGSEVELTDGQTFKAQAFLYGTSGGIRVARFKLK